MAVDSVSATPAATTDLTASAASTPATSTTGTTGGASGTGSTQYGNIAQTGYSDLKDVQAQDREYLDVQKATNEEQLQFKMENQMLKIASSMASKAIDSFMVQ